MAVSYKDYYKLLDVPRTATKDEISKAYKKLARKLHPDLNPGDAGAEERFKDINEAYEVLKDEEKRKLYDTLGPDWQHGQQFQNANFGGAHFSGSFNGGDFSDFFETLFGNARGGGYSGYDTYDGQGGFGGGFSGGFGGGGRKPRRGRDIEAELGITLEEAYSGGKKTITMNTGDGERTLEVNIPKGVKDGAKLRLAGQGRQGAAGPGDLILILHFLPHAQFSLDGINIIAEVSISPWEAVLGGKVRVPTLEGVVEMTIPAGSSSGRKLRIRGKGLGQGAEKGDEIIKVAIQVPKPEELTSAQKELWEQLAQNATPQA